MSIYRMSDNVMSDNSNDIASNVLLSTVDIVANKNTTAKAPISLLRPKTADTKGMWNLPSASSYTGINNQYNMFTKKLSFDPNIKPTKKVVNPSGTTPPSSKGSLSTVGAANIATGISTAANVVTSIYGAVQASKMKPALMKYQAPTEAVLVDDNSSAIETAGKENIDKSINTARDSFKRAGLAGMDGILLSKENEGLNQLSGQLSQYRTGIDSQNAQIQNSVNAQNKQTAMQVDQFNASTQNQFDQYKSGLIGTAMKNATDSIQSGTESIFGNMMAGSQMQLSSINSEISTIMEQLKNPNAEIFNKDLRTRLETLQKKKEQLGNSVFGQTNLKV